MSDKVELMGGGIFSDSTSLPFGVDLKTSVFHNNSFYLAFRSTNNAVVNGHTFSTTNIGYKDYVVIWKSGSLIDSSSLPFIKSGQIYPAFALSKSGKLYFGCDVYRMGDTSIIGLNFIKGRKQNFNSEYFKYWGPIVNDSFEWTSRLEGSGPGTSIMSVDENSQYISSSVGHWVDFDPGPYKWQYNPTVYIGRNVMAAYNCYPNAIFTYNQQDQRIDLVNFSSGSDSFLWDFGFNKQTSKEPNPVVHYPAVGDYTITLIAFNDCGSDTFSFPININKISSVENIALEDFNVFPNPFSDYIEIATTHETEITQIILYSINGKELLSANPQTLNKFNLNHLKNGTYIIRLIHENGSSSKRIVKQ